MAAARQILMAIPEVQGAVAEEQLEQLALGLHF
jgi:hypothetical protein